MISNWLPISLCARQIFLWLSNEGRASKPLGKLISRFFCTIIRGTSDNNNYRPTIGIIPVRNYTFMIIACRSCVYNDLILVEIAFFFILAIAEITLKFLKFLYKNMFIFFDITLVVSESLNIMRTCDSSLFRRSINQHFFDGNARIMLTTAHRTSSFVIRPEVYFRCSVKEE